MDPITLSFTILSLLEKYGPTVVASVTSMIQKHKDAKAALTLDSVLADWASELPIINRSYEADITAAQARNFPLPQVINPVPAQSSGPGQVVTAGALQAAVATL